MAILFCLGLSWLWTLLVGASSNEIHTLDTSKVPCLLSRPSPSTPSRFVKTPVSWTPEAKQRAATTTRTTVMCAAGRAALAMDYSRAMTWTITTLGTRRDPHVRQPELNRRHDDRVLEKRTDMVVFSGQGTEAPYLARVPK